MMTTLKPFLPKCFAAARRYRAQEEYARAQDRYWLAWSNGVLRQCLARQTNKETAAAEARKRPGWHPEEEHRREVGGD